MIERIKQKDFIEQIKLHPSMLTWCQEKNQEIIGSIKKLLAEAPFTAERYAIICGAYQAKAALRKLLIRLSTEPLIYLQGDDKLQVFIMEQLVAHELFDLQSCLETIHANSEKPNKYSTLFACLSISCNENLILLVINKLNERNINKTAIWHYALKNPQSFQLLIDTYSKDKVGYKALFDVLTTDDVVNLKFNQRYKKIWGVATEYSESFEMLINAYSKDETGYEALQDILEETMGFCDEFTFFDVVHNPILFKSLLKAYSENEMGTRALNKVLKIQHGSGTSIWMSAACHYESLKMLLEIYLKNAGYAELYEELSVKSYLGLTVVV